MTYTAPPLTEIILTRVIQANSTAVYDAWLDHRRPGGPWHGSTTVTLDPRVDGLFYHAVVHEGRTWSHYGRFITLDRPRRIAHTWVSEGTRGLESVLTIDLEPLGDRTQVTLRHAGVPDDDFGRQHRDGWTWVLGGMETRFAARDH
jgi:uncharacterized protein YndB with AHSA1/START domain